MIAFAKCVYNASEQKHLHDFLNPHFVAIANVFDSGSDTSHGCKSH